RPPRCALSATLWPWLGPVWTTRAPATLKLMSPPRKTWGERAVSRWRSRSPIVLLLFLAAVMSAALVVGDAVVRLHSWVESHFEWRDAEYRKLTSLQAGFTVAKFRDVLGPPLFERAVSGVVPQPFANQKSPRRGLIEG